MVAKVKFTLQCPECKTTYEVTEGVTNTNWYTCTKCQLEKDRYVLLIKPEPKKENTDEV